MSKFGPRPLPSWNKMNLIWFIKIYGVWLNQFPTWYRALKSSLKTIQRSMGDQMSWTGTILQLIPMIFKELCWMKMLLIGVREPGMSHQLTLKRLRSFPKSKLTLVFVGWHSPLLPSQASVPLMPTSSMRVLTLEWKTLHCCVYIQFGLTLVWLKNYRTNHILAQLPNFHLTI